MASEATRDRLMKYLSAPRGVCSSCGRVVTIFKRKAGDTWLARRHKEGKTFRYICDGSGEPITKEVS